jgi:predicted nucleotidyltransferase
MARDIQEALQQHKQVVLDAGYAEDQIIGVFLYGSQNYGLATEDSDVDTKVVIIPTLENLIILLDGFSYGVIGQLVKEANEDEYIVYKSPDILVKEELIRDCLIPESKRSNTINPNYTMIMYFKNKYSDPNERLNNFIDMALKCYTNELV